MYLVAILPIFNELVKGNLIRCLNNLNLVRVDKVIILDDGSEDGSYEFCKAFNGNFQLQVYRNEKNSLLAEGDSRWWFLSNKAVEDGANWIIVCSTDCVLSASGLNGSLRNILEQIAKYYPNITKLTVREPQLWRSENYYRMDPKWNWYMESEGEKRIWKNNGQDLKMQKKAVIHRSHHFPSDITGEWSRIDNLYFLHYAWVTKEKIIEKFRHYMNVHKFNKNPHPILAPGPEDCPNPPQCYQYNSFKLLEEFSLKLEKCREEWFSDTDRPDMNEKSPEPISYHEIIGEYCGPEKEKEYKEYFEKIYGKI